MIQVFKTSVLTVKDVELLRPWLERLPQTTWSFDLEDCDKVLRTDGPPEVSEKIIIYLLQDKGYTCEVLLD
jgi:hypothetical protein